MSIMINECMSSSDFNHNHPGRCEVILGWDKGVAIKKGEKCTLTCKPDYAYGSMSIGPIPPSCTLQFEVDRERSEDLLPIHFLVVVLIFVLGSSLGAWVHMIIEIADIL